MTRMVLRENWRGLPMAGLGWNRLWAGDLYDWSGELTWTEGGTAIIRGEKPESEPNEGNDR
jgi:hypothetical protein